MLETWEARYGKFEAKSAPARAGCVLVVFVGYERGTSGNHPQYGGYSRGTAARVFLFGADNESWAAALTELLRENPARKDVWAFQASAPVKPRLQLER